MELSRLYDKWFLNSEGISTNTRTINSGELFFALSGENYDGNEFALEALEKGALGAIVSDLEICSKDKRLIYTPNTLQAIQGLAKLHRKTLDIPVIGITGSNGKTTTKELIASALSKKYRVLATLGNLNNHIGVPLTLLRVSKKDQIAIIEMGANHLKEIKFLCSIAQPNYGVITNFGKAHLGKFGSFQSIIQAKSELYNFIRENKDTVFVYANDEFQLRKSEGINRVLFGDKKSLEFRIENISKNEFVSARFKAIEIHSKLTGRYNFSNIAFACCVAYHFNVPIESICNAIESYIPSNNRSQILTRSGKKIILDAYNANPTSMKEALLNFAQFSGKKVAILGDMNELGVYSKSEHAKIVEIVKSQPIDKVLFVGSMFYETEKKCLKSMRFKTSQDLVTFLEKNCIDSEAVLIKGSRSMKLEQIVGLI